MSWRQRDDRSKTPLLALLGGGIIVVLLTLHYLVSPGLGSYGLDTLKGLCTASSADLTESVVTSSSSTNQTVPSCAVDESISKRYGKHNIRATRVHEGTGHRVQQVLKRLEAGEKVKVGVIGGSVSNGHGMLHGHKYQYHAIEKTWHSFVSSWMNETFDGEQVVFINGAKAATDSGYFRFCWTAALKYEVQAPDLVFVEMDVNDLPDDASRDATEAMIRSILSLPNNPAVVFVGAFALQSQTGDGGMLNGGDAHMALSSFYDVPQISVRGPLLPALLNNRTLADPYFNGDERHIAAPVHQFLGEAVVAYLQEQRCAAGEVGDDLSEMEALWPDLSLLGQVPPRRLTDSWKSKVVPPSAPPTCQTAGETLSLDLADSSWHLYSWKNTKTYLQTSTEGAVIAFNVEIPVDGEGIVGVGFLRSNSLTYKLGRLRCRVDEGVEAVIDGSWERLASLTDTQIVATGLSPGRHRLSCRTTAGSRKDWVSARIASVVSA